MLYNNCGQRNFFKGNLLDILTLPHLAYKGMWNFTELLRATLQFLDLVPFFLQNDQPAEREGAIVLAKEEGARIVRGED